MINTYLKILKLTSSEYQTLNKDNNTLYLLTDSKEIYVGTELYISPSDFHKLTLLNAIDLDRETNISESIAENYTSENCIVNGYYNNNHNYLLININRPDLKKIIQWKIGKNKTKDDDEVTSTFEYRTINKNNNSTTSWTPIADDNLNTSSTNPIQNKVVANKINSLEIQIEEISNSNNQFKYETGNIAADNQAWYIDTQNHGRWRKYPANDETKPSGINSEDCYGYVMTGTYQIVGDYCTITAKADVVEGWHQMFYSLPVAMAEPGASAVYFPIDTNKNKIPDINSDNIVDSSQSNQGDTENKTYPMYLISAGYINTRDIPDQINNNKTGSPVSVVGIRYFTTPGANSGGGTYLYKSNMVRTDMTSTERDIDNPNNYVYFTLTYKIAKNNSGDYISGGYN